MHLYLVQDMHKLVTVMAQVLLEETHPVAFACASVFCCPQTAQRFALTFVLCFSFMWFYVLKFCSLLHLNNLFIQFFFLSLILVLHFSIFKFKSFCGSFGFFNSPFSIKIITCQSCIYFIDPWWFCFMYFFVCSAAWTTVSHFTSAFRLWQQMRECKLKISNGVILDLKKHGFILDSPQIHSKPQRLCHSVYFNY